MSEKVDSIIQIIDTISGLSTLEREMVFINLFERGIIDFVRLSTLYVEKLDKENKEKIGRIANLGLMLASYSMNDTSNLGKTSREHLFKSGAFGNGDGSVFGKMLDDEFGKE